MNLTPVDYHRPLSQCAEWRRSVTRSFLENKGEGEGFITEGEFVPEDDDETYARERGDDPESSHSDSTLKRRTRSEGKPVMLANVPNSAERAERVELLRRSAHVDSLRETHG